MLCDTWLCSAHTDHVLTNVSVVGSASLEHLALTESPVEVSLDLFANLTVVATEELSLAGTATRSAVHADRAAMRWRREDGAELKRPTCASPGALPSWQRHHRAEQAPTVTLVPYDIRTFHLEVVTM